MAGYRGAGTERILDRAGVTKGSLYHHFGSKQGLGRALVREVLGPRVLTPWADALSGDRDPIDALQGLLGRLSDEPAAPTLSAHAVLVRLAGETPAAGEAFTATVESVYEAWHTTVRDALARGQARGSVRGNVDPAEAATLCLAIVDGAVGLARLRGDAAVLRSCLAGVRHYLEALRPRRAFRGLHMEKAGVL